MTDEGIGVSEQDQRNLFKMYFRTEDENSLRINKQSNGIGLHFCKRLAQLLGGDLVYNS